MQTISFPASQRGKKDAGWLQSNFIFSFSDFAHPGKMAFGTLVAFNDDYVEPGKGFGLHPHINMEIISVLLAGRMNHKDSMGYSTVIQPGGVQIMSAGSGLRHEEYNVGEDPVNFLQIWIEPKQQNIIPRYQQRHFSKSALHNRLVPVVSCQEGQGHCWINQNTVISLAQVDPGFMHTYRLDPVNKCLFVFVIEGSLETAGHLLGARDALGIWETDQLTLHSISESYFLVIETPVNQK